MIEICQLIATLKESNSIWNW